MCYLSTVGLDQSCTTFFVCILQMKRSDQREMTKTEDGHVLHAGEVAAGTEIEDVHVTGIQERRNPEGL